MKRFIIIALGLLITACAVSNPLDNVTTQGLTYDGTDIYYEGELCAKLSAYEIALDNGKIVKEATFILTDSKFNAYALPVIKLVKEKRPSLEVEVELKK